jgi:antitoxin YefM
VAKMNNRINTISATDAGKDWSQLIDSVVREKPQIIRRTRDCVFIAEIHIIESILSAYNFTADKYVEDDGTITLSLNEMDLVVNGSNERETVQNLAAEILEYAEEYYNDFLYWSNIPNRKKHIPYILKALILDDINKIGESITCLVGKN